MKAIKKWGFCVWLALANSMAAGFLGTISNSKVKLLFILVWIIGGFVSGWVTMDFIIEASNDH